MLVLLLLLVLALSACGKEEEPEVIPEQDHIGGVKTNTLRISASGALTEIAVEDYSGTQYQLADIEKFVRSEIDSYNKEKGVEKISFLQIRDDNGIVKTAIAYNDITAYNEFNHVDLKLTAYNSKTADSIAAEEAEQHAVTEEKKELSEAELAEAGYDASSMDQQEIEDLVEDKAVTATLADEKGNKVASDAIDANEKMMLITTEKLNVVLEDGKVLYTNDHAVVDGTAAQTDGEGKAIVVLFLGL